MFELRDYQKKSSKDGFDILRKKGILILNFEVRTGKTHIALDIGRNYNNVLFVTKKKAISSIEADYKTAGHQYSLTVINYESLHKVIGRFDLVIADESHGLGAYPKPSKRVKELSKHITKDLILMTGTLLPESNAQIYHQLYVSHKTPFRAHRSFYNWHKVFGTPATIYTSYGEAKDYSIVDYSKIKEYIQPILLTYTQKEAGFNSNIQEKILRVPIKESTIKLANRLKKDLVVEGKDEVLLADTGVKLMSKLHQLYSGTVKFESGNSKVIDYSKAEYIKKNFEGKKLAIFYKFKEELNSIKSVLDVTQDIEEFNTTDKHIALQIVSGREGTNLSKADFIIMYNIDFSAVSYWQARDRMTTIKRSNNIVYWLFSIGGIEDKIYKAVMNKKNYTTQTFIKDVRIEIPKKDN
jgi:DNA-binding transcriptional regulator YiaG